MRNDLRTVTRARLAADVLALAQRRRQDVVDMLEGCNVSPGDIPFGTSIRREGAVIHLERFVRDESTGHILLNDDRTEPRVEAFSVTPDHIPEWIPAD